MKNCPSIVVRMNGEDLTTFCRALAEKMWESPHFTATADDFVAIEELEEKLRSVILEMEFGSTDDPEFFDPLS